MQLLPLLGDADVSHSISFADSNPKAQAGQGVGQLRQGHRQWRLWRGTEGQGRIAWAIDQTRTKVLESSKGPVVGEGQSVEVNYYGVNGRTGKKFDESFTNGQPVAFSLAQVVPGFSKGLVGQRQGSRADCHAGQGRLRPDGRQPASRNRGRRHLIFVVDLVDVQLAGPRAAPYSPRRGFRQTDKGGKPEVTIPESAPPTTLRRCSR